MQRRRAICNDRVVRAVTLGLMLCLLGASPRARAQPRPTGASQGPRVTVLRTTRASLQGARRALTRLEPAALACLATARQSDADQYARVSRATLTVGLGARGEALAVSLHPSVEIAGFSACLAEVFLRWLQPGGAGPRASVELALRF
ncbi:MAG: hypothetical protein JNK72_18290 [Myxococcales bacterium]|nr:hypothetical protein [Myxococcales bacterium]